MSQTDDDSLTNASLMATSPGLAGDAPETDPHDTPCRATIESEPRNFFWLAMHQVLMRIGWVFKTESIVMPYFLDLVGGSPEMRGMLMVLNRFGFSIPPAIFAPRLKAMPQKRWAVAIGTFTMAIPFALLSIVWASGIWKTSSGEPATWMPYFFLTVYGIFFIATGLNQLASHSIQGKLIRPHRRGRLFAAGVAVGAPIAVLCAWYLMQKWLQLPDGGFTWLFAAPAVAFVLASLMLLQVREINDSVDEPCPPVWRRMSDAWSLVLKPGPCRTIAILSLLYSGTFTLFPHYQAMATERASSVGGGEFNLRSLMIWTITQHISVAVLSLLIGPIADRFGTRLAVRIMVFGSMLSPLTAIGLSTLPPAQMAKWYWLVFMPLGFTPVTIKMIINYLLELVPRIEHPRYISSIGLCLAMPVMVGSPFVGYLVGKLGFVPVFAGGAFILLVAGLQSLRLIEPRHE